MKIVLAALHYGLLRNFESVVAGLAREGHDVVLVAEEEDETGGRSLAESLVRAHETVKLGRLPDLRNDPVVELSKRLRAALDYFRFHEPPYDRAEKLRGRFRPRVPRLFAAAGDRFGRIRSAAWLAKLEHQLPPSRPLLAWLEAERPDALLLASLTHYRSAAPEMHRAADALGIPVAACIYSWDHLSSKALLRRVPDQIVVWNEIQAREAVDLHGMPRERIAVTGAQCYDQWFDRKPSRPHAQFCRTAGLDPHRPFLLWVCSALTPSPNEPGLVLEWIGRLRRSERRAVREMGVLIRPHPERRHEWDGVDVTGLDNVSLVDAAQLKVDRGEGRDDYFDALWHASAVIGLVTSVFLEAAVIGRPVMTVALPELEHHQDAMQHFRYLLEVEDGLPMLSRTLDEHIAQLDAILNGGVQWEARQKRFIRTFVRPAGLDRASTPLFVEAITQGMSERAKAPVSGDPSLAAALALRINRVGLMRRLLLSEAEWRTFKGLRMKAGKKRRKSRIRRRRQIMAAVRRVLTARPRSAGNLP